MASALHLPPSGPVSDSTVQVTAQSEPEATATVATSSQHIGSVEVKENKEVKGETEDITKAAKEAKDEKEVKEGREVKDMKEAKEVKEVKVKVKEGHADDARSTGHNSWVFCNTIGYGQLMSVDESGTATVRTPWGAVCYAPRGSLQSEVTLHLVTFAKACVKGDLSGSPPEKLHPFSCTVNVNDTINTVIDQILHEYAAFDISREEVHLVLNGKEVTETDVTVAECNATAPFRMLLILSPKTTDFGGWLLVSDGLSIEGQDRLAVRKTSADDKWKAIRTVKGFNASEGGVHSVSFKVMKVTPTNNSWKICVGIVTSAFDVNADRVWIGSQPDTWSYILGSGTKCNNSGVGAAYSDKYNEGDVIRVQLDFSRGEIEFFKNEQSQGVAFNNLPSSGELFPAVSLTGKDSVVCLLR